MSLGLFIGRLNPPHIGHVKIIEKALKENDKVLLLLGSPLLKDDSNPLDFDIRKNILNIKYKDIEKLEIVELVDTTNDYHWLYNMYQIINNYYLGNDINFYGGDFKNDSAYLVIKKYEDFLRNYKINYIENNRNDSNINYKGTSIKISATNLRKAFSERDYDLAKKMCNSELFEEIKRNI